MTRTEALELLQIAQEEVDYLEEVMETDPEQWVEESLFEWRQKMEIAESVLNENNRSINHSNHRNIT